MTLRDSWRIAALTRERDALAVMCAALILLLRMSLKRDNGRDMTHDVEDAS